MRASKLVTTVVTSTFFIVTVGTSPQAQAAFPGANGVIAYGAGDGNLHVISSDGSGDQSLGARGQVPAWSPNGKKIAFSDGTGGGSDIYLMNADGTGRAAITNTADSQETNPSWSPDGTQLAFSMANGSVYSINVDGTNRRQLTTTSDFEPSWSPDGTRIAFQSERDGISQIYVMNADGSGQTRFTNDGASDQYPSWSPDGNKIAFVSTRNSSVGNYEVYVANADGSNQTRLTDTPAPEGQLAWSPDGSRIVFDRYDAGTWRLFEINADGTGETPLNVNGVAPDWQPSVQTEPASGCATWTQASPRNAPASRFSHVMAYDSDRGVTVLFGGYDDPSEQTTYGTSETWEYDGTTWVQRTPANSPPSIPIPYAGAMTYDSSRHVTVLVTYTRGATNLAIHLETWEWDGTDWTHRPSAHAPPNAYEYSLAFDSARHTSILVGTLPDMSSSATWEWDGVDWTQRTPASSTPPPDRTLALAFDSVRERTVLIAEGSSSLDAWEWDGIDWSHPAVSSAPPARYGFAVAYDPTTRRTILFGGANRSYFSDTWSWDGSTWTQLSPVPLPDARQGHAMVYDQRRHNVLLFGGVFHVAGTNYDSFFGDTWTVCSNTAPHFNPVPAQIAYVDNELRFTIHASDADGDPLAYSMTSSPVGANFDSDIQAFSWTPIASDLGNVQAMFWVFDSAGRGDQLTVNIHVTKLLIGLGDSIASGHALGYDEGAVDAAHPSGDNSDAYPQRVARVLGFGGLDYAINGACGATKGGPDANPNTPSNWNDPSGKPQSRCTDSVLNEEIPRLLDSGKRPSVITLTVGADDILFGDCMMAIFIGGSNPCSEPMFTNDLGAFRANLTSVLGALQGDFPSAKIILTRYYDPLPPPPGANEDACPLFVYEAMFKHMNPFIDTDDQSAKALQTDAWRTAESVLLRLNSDVIQGVANSLGIPTVDLQPPMVGHDMCRQYGNESATSYLYAPQGIVTVNYYPPGAGPITGSVRLTPSDICDGSHCPGEQQSGSGSITPGVLDYAYEFSTNGAPHPTKAGQARIASLVVNAVKST